MVTAEAGFLERSEVSGRADEEQNASVLAQRPVDVVEDRKELLVWGILHPVFSAMECARIIFWL